jgi:prevent-host-death family protein
MSNGNLKVTRAELPRFFMERHFIINTHIGFESAVLPALSKNCLELTYILNDHRFMTMVKSSSAAVPRGKKSTVERRIPAGEFKAKCLKLIDEVGTVELIITKRGIPVARLLPYNAEDDSPLAGMIVSQGDLISPVGETWDIDP